MPCPCCGGGNVPCPNCFSIKKEDFPACYDQTTVLACGNSIGVDYVEPCMCIGDQAFWNGQITSCNNYAQELSGQFSGCSCIRLGSTCVKFSVTEKTENGQCVCWRQRRIQNGRDHIYVWNKDACLWELQWQSGKYLVDDTGFGGFNPDQCDEPAAPDCDPPTCAGSYITGAVGDCDCGNEFP